MRRIYTLVLALVIALSLPSFVHAAGKPVEMPDTKLIVDNCPVKLADVPLGLDGRTFLPLRAALVSLGVPDDAEHIKWDGSNGGITVVSGDRTICLKVGGKTALINGKAVELDVAPFLYAGNRRVYIPVRFAANAVGKEVAWDAAARTAYVRDSGEYAAMKSVLDGIDRAMNDARKARLTSKIKLNILKQGSKVVLDANMKEELDKKAGLLYSVTGISLFGSDLTFSSFCRDNAEYAKNPGGAWVKTTMSEKDFREMLEEDLSLSAINSIEVMAAALEKAEGAGDGEYVLKGRLFPKGLASEICKNANLEGLMPDNCSFEAVLDGKTQLVKTVHAEFGGTAVSGNSRPEISAVVDAEYTDYDGAFEIETPEGL